MRKFETLGREKLDVWAKSEGIGASEIARRMSTEAHTVLPSTVSRWLSGDARPDPQYRPILNHLAKIPEPDWLTAAERGVVEAAIEKGSAA
jgi:transcriptional regulator with XRE-family HTH domain